MSFEQLTAEDSDLTQAVHPTTNVSLVYDDTLPANDLDVPQLIYGGPSPGPDTLPSTPPLPQSTSAPSNPLPQFSNSSLSATSDLDGLDLFPTGWDSSLLSPLYQNDKHDLPSYAAPLENPNDEPACEEFVLPSLLWANPPAPEMPTPPGATRNATRRARQRKTAKKRPITGSVEPFSFVPLSPTAAAGPSRATEPAFSLRSLDNSPQDVPAQMGPIEDAPDVLVGNPLVPGSDGFQVVPVQIGLPVYDPCVADMLLRQLEWAIRMVNGDAVLYPDPNFGQALPIIHSHPPPLLSGESFAESTEHGQLPAGPSVNPIDVNSPSSASGLTSLGAIDAPDVSEEFLQDAVGRRMDELDRQPDATNSEEDTTILTRCLTRIVGFAPIVPPVQDTPGASKTRKKPRRVCFKCSRTLASPQRLSTHLAVHLKMNRVKCPECGAVRAGDLPRHFRLVHKKCHKCGGFVVEDGTINHAPDCVKRRQGE